MNLNSSIQNLKYDANKVLAYEGEKISNFIPKQGELNSGKFIVISKIKRDIQDKLFDISVITSILDRVYLGSILLANQKLIENLPTEVKCKKKEISFRVNNLPGLTSEESIAKIENPQASSVMGKIADISNLWLNKYSTDYRHASILEYKESMLFSEAQMLTEFGLETKPLISKLNIDYSNNNSKQIYLCRLKQIFYSATMDAPNSPSDLIDESVTFEELQAKGVDSKNPPVYVSNIDFGRVVYIKLESSENTDKVKEAFSAVVRGVDISQKLDYMNIMKNSTFSLVVIGGTIKEMNGIGLASIEEIKKLLSSGLSFTKENPGVPISYTTTFLKNNELAITNTKTEYIETKREIFSNGELKIEHFGGYVARAFINWEEINYDESGKELIKSVAWSGNGRNQTAPFKTVIPLPANARNISIKVEGATGLVWNPWTVSIDRKNIPLINSRILRVVGTTLNQKSVLIPD